MLQRSRNNDPARSWTRAGMVAYTSPPHVGGHLPLGRPQDSADLLQLGHLVGDQVRAGAGARWGRGSERLEGMA